MNREFIMKLTPKKKATLTRVLEALKSQHYIESYQIEGDELSSIQARWEEGAAERASTEILQNVGLAGIKRSERGWVAFVLPKECREQLIEATLSSVREKGLQLCRMIMELPLGPRAGKSEVAGRLFLERLLTATEGQSKTGRRGASPRQD
jgi:hypothetical protein